MHDSTLELGPPEGVTVHPKWLTHFHSHSGKAVLNKSPWEWFSDFYERITPTGDELWVTNGRINELWQSAFDDVRKPYIHARWPEHFVEMHPDDAAARGVESGDEVRIASDDILVQTGGFAFVGGDSFLFKNLDANGHIKRGSGEMTAVALVTDAVRPWSRVRQLPAPPLAGRGGQQPGPPGTGPNHEQVQVQAGQGNRYQAGGVALQELVHADDVQVTSVIVDSDAASLQLPLDLFHLGWSLSRSGFDGGLNAAS